jgi:putative PIN family toxin of toxin-antitoxin system
VLDTNVWLDLLVFGEPAAAWLAQALESGAIEARIDEFGIAELERVLGYPLGRFRVSPDRRPLLLARCQSLATQWSRRMPSSGPPLPACRDPHDQPFLELAHAASVQWLITKDRDLLILERRLHGNAGFRIVRPEAARALLGFA